MGKVHVTVRILNEDSRPAEEDWASLRQHHERLEGGGHPCELAGQNISLAARVIAVVVTYDVITSARAHEKPMPAEEAHADITRCARHQSGRELLRAFVGVSVGPLHRIAGPVALLAAPPGVVVAPSQKLSVAVPPAQTAGG
ncbi:HD-GYP domain-containing protein [Kineococcus aurantiacus]|uniref:HD-GYP domain-containing protein (C-di-GMP phosphodiesterase class II) n=1 Tax=Kineococcus aurantiacus TaxID=37633 RepID=A0A7Y9DQW3_9ACTN|nr:HD domain-containing phosphohydrolase [Kineococcus aurantiacus]NYD25083.1 HD-GYP domain-containing protein (c-di-GMP phosphodiesterase class II) [Kineococcus aurantiacus]